MCKITNCLLRSVLATAMIAISGLASASMLDLTNQGYGINLGHSRTFSIDGIDIKLSAWGTQWDANKNLINQDQASISAWRNYGLGIQSSDEKLHGYPEHTADNQGNVNDFFLVEFSQNVLLDKASVTEWGNSNGSYRGDSDISYWMGNNTFSWSSLGSVSYNNVSSDTYGNGERRNVNLGNGIDSIAWLVFGPSINGIDDAIKLRNIKFTTPEVSQVPIPAAMWLFGPGVIGLFGFFAARKPKPNLYINTNG